MGRFINKYKQLIIIAVATITALLLIVSYGDGKSDFILGLIGVLISLSYGSINVSMQRDSMFKELFSYFTEKYNKEFNDKLAAIVESIKGDPKYELTTSNERILSDYLNLCAEQYLWYSKGRIPEVVWMSWSNGMAYYFSYTQIKQFVAEEKSDSDSYYGFLDYLVERKIIS